ncbi:DsbC family protein [Eoetvoesiella caeni]
MKALYLILPTIMSLLSGIAQAQSVDERLALAAKNVKIDEVATLPIKSFKAVHSDGQIVFMSENGRFVFTGMVYDIWQRKSLDTMGQIKDAVNRLSFNGMGLNIDQLNTVSMGKGKQQVVVFTDPLCTVCHQLMQDAKYLTDQYTFKYVVVPALGAASVPLSKKVACAKDPNQALLALMNNTLKTLATIEPCDSKVFDTTMVAADLMGINGVPFIVAPNGDIQRGRPSNLAAWLKDREV